MIPKPRAESDPADAPSPAAHARTAAFSVWGEVRCGAAATSHKGSRVGMGCHGYAVNDGVTPCPTGCEETHSVASAPHSSAPAGGRCRSCEAPALVSPLRLIVGDLWGQNGGAVGHGLGGGEHQRQRLASTGGGRGGRRSSSKCSKCSMVCATEDGVSPVHRRHRSRRLSTAALGERSDNEGRNRSEGTEGDAPLSSRAGEECWTHRGLAYASASAGTRAGAIALSLFQRLLGQAVGSRYFHAWWRFILLKTRPPKGVNTLAHTAAGAQSQCVDPSRFCVSVASTLEASRTPSETRGRVVSPELMRSTASVGETLLGTVSRCEPLLKVKDERDTRSLRCSVSVAPAFSAELPECLSLFPARQISPAARRLRSTGAEDHPLQGAPGHAHAVHLLNWRDLLVDPERASRAALRTEESNQRSELQLNARRVLDKLFMVALCGQRRISLSVPLRANSPAQAEEVDAARARSGLHLAEKK
ncbi:uncharacterized protein Tco025E_06575 [Trypanosoma conorhini]|uniref:Uncharacterized protein n=1 Tax=Trypanosoma conorhini TaxID=83891 RepID=A0A422P216_9TRYP|nr:uncharacterized protein Tco025E_06575 [Trypanosoma conorhini]RNF11724.1 hypothetical protein Tco025E_06575 [Trypanosoma conorhini]